MEREAEKVTAMVEMPDILRCSGRDRMYVSAFVKRILKRYLR
jgi:hypothetical protein